MFSTRAAPFLPPAVCGFPSSAHFLCGDCAHRDRRLHGLNQFDADDHSNLVISLQTSHGRNTPLL